MRKPSTVATVTFALAAAWPAGGAAALAVRLVSPPDTGTVSGRIAVTGTSTDAQRVFVAIDGGSFEPAQGLDVWSFEWDASAVADGPHQITAEARGVGPPARVSVDVTVDNSLLAVSILNPAEAETVFGTLVVTGGSNLATAVSLQVDSGPFEPANGLDLWNVVIEAGALAPGPHTLTARAEDGVGGEAFDTVAIVAGDPSPGTQDVTYLSSVDGEPMDMRLYVPPSYDPTRPSALVVHLHGGGGLGVISPDMQAELDARGWLGIAPDGRRWGLAVRTPPCTWQTSAAYVDSTDPDVGPGEQDIFDAVDWTAGSFAVDPDRLYLTGFSMGGRGTYAIGLKNPDRFAAIAPMGPAVDMYEIDNRRPEPAACKAGMAGGEPGDSPLVDTMYSITSGRFLLENAYNLPVFHAHGTVDPVANNDPGNAPFLHGRHITVDDSWAGCHGALCFGHTPTLGELAARHPDGYDWAYLFTPVAHTTDPKWLAGTPVAAGDEGIEDPLNPGELLGIYDFFERRRRIASPDTVVFKSYTDSHRRAYWAEIELGAPWTDLPGAVRARRSPAGRQLDVELARVRTATFDLRLAGLPLGSGEPLTVALAKLSEPVYDPALDVAAEPLDPTLVLADDFAGVAGVVVLRDGVPLPPAQVVLTATAVTIGPLAVTAPTVLVVMLDSDGDGRADVDDCAAADPAAFALPPQVGGLLLYGGAGDTTLVWVSVAAVAGSGTVYDVVRGRLDELPLGSGPAETCLLSAATATTASDAAPAPASGFFYQVRGVNDCGAGPYGGGASSACP